MTQVQQLEECILALKKLGYRPTTVEVMEGFLKVDGLEPLPPGAEEIEDEEESARLRSEAEESRQRLRDLGLR